MRRQISVAISLAWLTPVLPCLLGTTGIAAPIFFSLGETGGVTSLLEIDPADPSSVSTLGPTGVEGLFWLEYDPRNDWLLAAHTPEQKLYHIDPRTGAATAFPANATCNRMQGMAYVPPLGEVLIAYSLTATTDRLIGVVNENGSITQLFDLSTQGVGDLDEILWDPTRQQLYGISSQQRNHFTIDIYDGSVTSFTFDEGNPLFGSVNPDDGLMYEVRRRSTPLGGFPDLWTRNPETAVVIDHLGTIPGVDTVRGLAFTPEPSTALLLMAGSLVVVRRRGRR